MWIGLENYRQLMHDPLFWKSLGNTFYYAAMALPAGMMVSLGLALLLNVKIRGQAIYRTIIFLPSLVPVVASAMLWLWLFNARLGLFNLLLGKIGIEPGRIGWERAGDAGAGDDELVGRGEHGGDLSAGCRMCRAELYEAAEIDGAGRLRAICACHAAGDFAGDLFQSDHGDHRHVSVSDGAVHHDAGRADNATYFFTMYLYDNAFIYLHMGYASAMAWVQLLIILVLTAIAFWSAKRWVHYG